MKTVVIVGEGLLAAAVCQRLAPFAIVQKVSLSEALPPADLALVLGGDASLRLQAEETLLPAGIPWLCSYVSNGEGIVGPLVRPGVPGCSQCTEARLSMAGTNESNIDDLLMHLISSAPTSQPVEDLSPAGLRHLTQLIIGDVSRVLQGNSASTEGRMYIVNLNSLNTSIHRILPNPVCPVCGTISDDTKEAADVTLQPNPKLRPNEFRTKSMNDLRKVLVQHYFDRRTGLFNAKQYDFVSPFASAVVNLPLLMSNEITGGRSHCYADSELGAILEGLERHCGMAPLGKRTVVYDSYSRLKEIAMDPTRVGLHEQEQLEQPDFPFVPFDPDAQLAWVWGYSFLQKRPILVPELLAYYSFEHEGGFVYETSNGCAIGGSLEEAILYGLFEVIERDSFLMTWYAKLPVPRLDYRSCRDVELLLMIERLQAVTGYEVTLYNTTMENGIPSIWAVARGSSEQEQRVNLVCAAGAHLDPIRAAKGAIHELATIIAVAEERLLARREDAEAMVLDSSLVQQMEDHSLLYSLPQTEERLRFLLDEQRPSRTFDEEFAPISRHHDLTDDLKQVLQVFDNLGLEVIVINQSTSEILRNGLHCVKVLVPGMLPMTFGHKYTRLRGLDRVLELPMKLGYASGKLSYEDLNPFPHPFP